MTTAPTLEAERAAPTIEQIKELARQQREEAKNQLSLYLVDVRGTERIVDCIVNAAVLEITAMMRETITQGGANG